MASTPIDYNRKKNLYFKVVVQPTNENDITVDLSKIKHWFKSGYCKIKIEEIYLRLWGGNRFEDDGTTLITAVSHKFPPYNFVLSHQSADKLDDYEVINQNGTILNTIEIYNVSNQVEVTNDHMTDYWYRPMFDEDNGGVFAIESLDSIKFKLSPNYQFVVNQISPGVYHQAFVSPSFVRINSGIIRPNLESGELSMNIWYTLVITPIVEGYNPKQDI